MVYTLVLEASAARIESSSLSRRTTIWGMGLLGVDTCFASRTQIGSNPIFSTKRINMKSPVYRLAGNVKCRGKKTKLLSCSCCMMIDFRWDYRFKQAAKEIL